MGMRNKKNKNIETDYLKKLTKSLNYKAIDSFCGPGGISLGLKWAGFELLLAFDNNEKAVETFNKGVDEKAIVADAKKITARKIFKKTGLKKGELDLFAGGPPCQGFSKQKRGAHLGDKRNDLISEYIRLARELKPKFFLFENVAIFGQKRGKKYIDEMNTKLTDYKLYPRFYNTADYGLAQTRDRFIVVGQRKDQKTSFLFPTPSVKQWKTLEEVIGGMPEPPEDYSEHPDYPNHQRARVSDINIFRFSFVSQGGGWQNIPYEHRLKCHKNANTKNGGWPDVYGRLEWKGQCPTITGGFDSFTRGRYGHPEYDRPLTPREAARIQGFPDDFRFYGTRADQRFQIGNAVPPPLIAAIGAEIARSLLISDNVLDSDMPEGINTEKLLKIKFG